MKKVILIFILNLIVAGSLYSQNNPPNAPTDLLCEGQSNPIGLEDFTPDLSWTFSDPDIDDSQSAYQILVSSSIEEINSNIGNIWDSKQVASSQSTTSILYNWRLKEGCTYYWKIRTWDNHDSSGPYSQMATFSMVKRSYYGIPHQIPGKIECEDFDLGGEGVAYHDIDSVNQGGEYRPDEGVDIEICNDTNGGYDITNVEAGEWLEYIVNVTASGCYLVEVRVACNGTGGTYHIEVNGKDVTGSLPVPDTGGNQNWVTIYYSGVCLIAGIHIMRLSMDSNGTNGKVGSFNYINIVYECCSPSITVISPNGGGTWYAGTEVTVQWSAASDCCNEMDSVKIDLSTSGTVGPWITLISSTINDGSQQISVPDYVSKTCRIRISDIDGYPSDYSNNNLTISLPQQPEITVTSPNGGETWPVGQQETILWVTQGAIGNVNIDLSTDGGSSWITFVSSTTNDGTEQIIVPCLPTATGRIRVQEVDGTPSDMSNSNFTMEPGGPCGPFIELSSTTLNFGEVPIGETKTLTFKISNTGYRYSGTLSGTITRDKEWIIIDPVSFSDIEPYGNITVNVIVNNNILKEKSGQHTGKITVNSNGFYNPSLEIDVIVNATCILPKPNPYNPINGYLTFYGSGIVPDDTKITIYTLNGELVKTLKNEFEWDGTNEQGETVSNGIYIYIYESPNEKGIGKFTVIRN